MADVSDLTWIEVDTRDDLARAFEFDVFDDERCSSLIGDGGTNLHGDLRQRYKPQV